MTEYICADCGHMGEEFKFFKPPVEVYQGDCKMAVKFIKREKLLYVGCEECQSSNIFFDAKSDEIIKDDQKKENLDDDYINLSEQDFDLDEEFVEKKRKKKKTKKKTKKIKTETATNQSNQFQIAPESKKTVSRSGVSGGQNITGQTYVANEVSPNAVVASEVPDVLFRKGNAVVRPKYKRKCKDCRSKFETKHSAVFYCKDCLKDFGRR